MPQQPSQSKAKKPIPVYCFVNGYAARLAGVPLKRYLQDIPLNFQIQMAAQKLHGYQDKPTYGWADWGGWEFGCLIRWPESYAEGAPATMGTLVARPGDLDQLRLPNPEKSGAAPLLAAFNQQLAEHGLPVKVRGGSPTSVVAGILGKERYLRWLIREPAAIERAYQLAVDHTLSAARATVRRFGNNASASFSAPLDANTLISPETFERFVVPALARIISGLASLGIDSLKVHICGDHGRNLPLWAGLPWPKGTFFSIGHEISLGQAARAFGPDHTIGGNLSTNILANGSAEEVYRAAWRCLEQGADLPCGFALMPACEMPVTAPPLNVAAMVNAARDFNRDRNLEQPQA